MWNYLKAILLTMVIIGILIAGPIIAVVVGAVFVIMFVFFAIKGDLDDEDGDND